MAFNVGTILNIAFDSARVAQTATHTTYSAALVTVLGVVHFPTTLVDDKGRPWSETKLRQVMAAGAVAAGINPDSWATNVNGVVKAAAKIAEHARSDAAGEAFAAFDALPDLSEADAVTTVQQWLTDLGILTPKHLLAWSKQTGFGKYDPTAAKAARSETKAKDALTALMTARVDPKVAPVAGVAGAVPAPSDPIGFDNLIERIGALMTGDECMKLIDACNARLLALDALVKSLPAPTVAPVLSDDATVQPGSGQAALADRVEAADKLAAIGRVRKPRGAKQAA